MNIVFIFYYILELKVSFEGSNILYDIYYQ